MNTISMTIDNSVIDEYAAYYFEHHPRARLKPITLPYHPSLNEWTRMRRCLMNAVKQKWKDFGLWFVDKLGYSNLHIQQCDICFTTYYCTHRRHDNDNSVPKFMLDALVESGMLVDDDNKHLKRLILESYTDSENPRTEITIYIDDKEIKNGKSKKTKTGK